MTDTAATIANNLTDALDYEETESLTKAKQVVTYAMQLIVKRAASQSNEGSSLSWDIKELRQILNDARAYVKASTDATSARVFDMSRDFR